MGLRKTRFDSPSAAHMSCEHGQNGTGVLRHSCGVTLQMPGFPFVQLLETSQNRSGRRLERREREAGRGDIALYYLGGWKF